MPKQLDLMLHQRKYNIPESSEVSILIFGEQHGPLNIILKQEGEKDNNVAEKLYKISVGNLLRDPLWYPLICFNGCVGTTSKGLGVNITPKMFASRLFYAINGELNTTLRIGRLFQQFLCEAVYTMEA